MVKWVEKYKYLGCVISEHLEMKQMLEERAKAGAKALNAWLSRCRLMVGQIRGQTFMK